MFLVVDTGILLRLLDRNDPKHTDIRRALRVLKNRGDTLVLSPQNAAEFSNVCTRPASSRGGFGLSIAETDRRLRLAERLFAVIPDASNAYSFWRQLVILHSVIGVKVHDARLVAWMQSHGVTHIVTLNPSDFARYQGITALAPNDVATPQVSP